MKHNIGMLVIWIVLSVLYYASMAKEGAPEWVKDFFIFNALGFFLVFLNQFIAEMNNDTNN